MVHFSMLDFEHKHEFEFSRAVQQNNCTNNSLKNAQKDKFIAEIACMVLWQLHVKVSNFS